MGKGTKFYRVFLNISILSPQIFCLSSTIFSVLCHQPCLLAPEATTILIFASGWVYWLWYTQIWAWSQLLLQLCYLCISTQGSHTYFRPEKLFSSSYIYELRNKVVERPLPLKQYSVVSGLSWVRITMYIYKHHLRHCHRECLHSHDITGSVGLGWNCAVGKACLQHC